MYHYQCQAIRVIDGDSLVLDIDLGFHIKVRHTARLLGINCPELRGDSKEAAQNAKVRLQDLCDDVGDDLCCRTQLDRTEKYGRILVELFPHKDAATSFNQLLLNEGLAVSYP